MSRLLFEARAAVLACEAQQALIEKEIELEKLKQQRKPLTNEQPKRWAVFCGICRKEWSVPYQHPGKSVCDDCVAAHGIKENT